MANLSHLSLLLLATSLAAQVAPGDIGVTGFSMSEFGVLTGGTATGYNIGSYGGTGTSQSILWDPSNPQSFVGGGFGFVGRATITGSGTASYALLSTNLGTAAQMSFDFAGNVVIADAGVDQVQILDVTTGTVTPLTSGPQPWGTTVNAGGFSSFSGDIVVGNQGDLYRIPFGSATPVLYAGGLGGYISNVIFDIATGDTICTVLQANRLLRIDSTGAQTDIMTPGAIVGPNAVVQDVNLDWLVGAGSGSVYRVPYAGGAPVLEGLNTAPSGTVSGVAVALSTSSGSWNAYGQGCAGTGGNVTLSITGTLQPGQTIQHVSDNHAPGMVGVALFGLSNTIFLGNPLPYSVDPLLGTSGCNLYAAIDATQIGITGAGTPATLSFSINIPSTPTGASFFLQHACFESAGGATSWSNGVVLQLP
ncbi:MAG: hypothetical protein KDE27_03340 [Planctomycetes bacterium]|nr:hypothetical protein [Planctomycetota bacterium]